MGRRVGAYYDQRVCRKAVGGDDLADGYTTSGGAAAVRYVVTVEKGWTAGTILVDARSIVV